MLNKDTGSLKNAKRSGMLNESMITKEDKKKRCHFYIDPDSKLARNWSILMLICLAWVAVIMPFNIGFIDKP